jgi:hypothetical protein
MRIFEKIFSQKWRYLEILSTDFAEKLPIWSFLHADSDFEDERSGKILQLENERYTGWQNGPNFWKSAFW